MATLVLTDAKIWVDGYDFSGDHNSINVEHGGDPVEETTFGQTTHIHKGGLRIARFNGGGFIDLADDGIDEQFFSRIAVDGTEFACAAEGGDEGEIAYILQTMLAEYVPSAGIGEMYGFRITGEGQGPLVRATIMQNGVETVTGNSTARQLGAVGATQKLYASMHVLAASGGAPTLDALVRSDDNEPMASPTTRITFAQATTISSQWATPVSGAITDDWWDIDMTIGGGGPSFTVAVFVGIL